MENTIFNPIEVSIRDAQKAFSIAQDSKISFLMPSTTEFVVSSEDDWNDLMERFEEQQVEIL